MRLFRPLLVIGALALAACSASAEKPPPDVAEPDAAVSVSNDPVRLSDAEMPPALRDLSNVAGIAGNDLVYHNAVTAIVRDVMDRRDFRALDAMERYFTASGSRLPGGGWLLGSFHTGIRADLSYRPREPGCKLRGTDFTSAWAKHDPEQPGITAASLYLEYAWCLRGSGYASDVSPEAWKPFEDNVDLAYRSLSEHAEIARRDPEYYALMEKIYTAQGRSDAEFQKLLGQASEAAPYYYRIYSEAAWHAMPQWGGSMAEVDRIARYAVERTRQQDGSGAYVRVYWTLANCGCDITKFEIDRKLLSRAMDDVFARTPSDVNAARFAKIACSLGDRDLTRQQFARGGRDDGLEWEDRGEWERCRRFAGLS